MSGYDATEPDRDEVERGRDALRELGVEPLPADVLARLDARLEGELGRPAPRATRTRRLPRLAFAIPGAGVALAAAVVVAVLATNGGTSRPPQHESAFSVQAKRATPGAPKATAGGAAPAAHTATSGGAAVDSGAGTQQLTAQVRVPALVGHGLGYLESATAARGLRWAELEGSTCPRVPSVRVKRQVPRAGATVPSGSTIRVSFGTCVRTSSSP
jgi:hypothetical protein